MSLLPRKPLPICNLGDVATPMLPHMSQGAAIFGEDKLALAMALLFIADWSHLHPVHKLCEKERFQRASQMPEASRLNSIILHFSNNSKQNAQASSIKAEVERVHLLVNAV